MITIQFSKKICDGQKLHMKFTFFILCSAQNWQYILTGQGFIYEITISLRWFLVQLWSAHIVPTHPLCLQVFTIHVTYSRQYVQREREYFGTWWINTSITISPISYWTKFIIRFDSKRLYVMIYRCMMKHPACMPFMMRLLCIYIQAST